MHFAHQASTHKEEKRIQPLRSTSPLRGDSISNKRSYLQPSYAPAWVLNMANHERDEHPEVPDLLQAEEEQTKLLPLELQSLFDNRMQERVVVAYNEQLIREDGRPSQGSLHPAR